MTEKCSDSFSSAIMDAMPVPVFIVNADYRIVKTNGAARPLTGHDGRTIYLRKCGVALHCLNTAGDPEGCGRSSACDLCVVRNSVAESLAHKTVVRRATKMVLQQDPENVDAYLLVTTAPLAFDGEQYVILTIENIDELVELRRLIPICAQCKKIRNEKEYWDDVETYFKTHFDLDFTHGICPECMHRLYPEIAAALDRKWNGS